ncbi:hypothetical protein E6O75_ATG01542 [Venturia nashicola]|uniref:Zn(2)-C6 fungal-type domain-containing protein n=1 Tax=Venturia nashicola TaxID=86259 RepID=A0A4Z1PVK5_9PEZI|nr:hypothetical protein E6O75_ATG01542 [Venturia nashicola]
MNRGLHLAPKRTRESTSKVRTGCSTCKARRVKCDEATPQCRRCAVGGRKCEYSIARIPATRNLITIYLPPTQSPAVLFLNDRALDFFQQKVATILDGQLNSDTEFWGKLVLQLSHSEPSIRHAVKAISFSYRDVESSLWDPAGYVNANPEAQLEWNKAIKSLSARIQTHPNSSLVPLVCCLLFTCIEFLKGNAESSMLHIQNGFKILATQDLDKDTISDGRPQFSSNDLTNIRHHVVPMFSRLNILCTLAGRITPQIHSTEAKKDSPPQNLADSRRQLFEISDSCIRFIREASPKAALLQCDFQDIIEQTKLQIRLDAWHDQLDELLKRLYLSDNPPDGNALNLLLVHYKVVYIWIRVCTTVEESATDSYHADFEEIIHHAEQITRNQRTSMATPQPVSFDIHILGPLFYTALKCRHPKLRRRALEILKMAPRREGLWNAHHAYVTAKRVIELEEQCLDSQGIPDETSRLHGLHLPDDDSRMYRIGETSAEFRKLDHNIVPSPVCPGTLEVVFLTKPWGPSKEYQEITEYLEL